MLSSLPSDWEEIAQPNSSSSDFPSVPSTSAQLLLPEDNHPATNRNVFSTPSNALSFQSTPVGDGTRLSYNAFANSTIASISRASPSLPSSPHSFLDCNLEQTETFAAVEQSSNSEPHKPKPVRRRRKARGRPDGHIERMPCPNPKCSKTFVRRCELT